MTDLATTPDADAQLKAKHRAVWASGDYPRLSNEVIAALGPVLVGAAGVSPGSSVLDVAAGSGNVAIPAARAGARVVASDLTPELLDAGRRAAAAAGVELEWQQADAEALPYADGEFDTVLSCVGVMFAPHHQVSADELVRVCRPGGTIALISWTPEGFIGQLFGALKPYAAPPPPGSQPPPLWGSESHVRDLLGDRVSEVVARRQNLTVDQFGTAEAFRDYFKTYYGPTIAVYRFLGDDQARVAALDEDLAALGRRHLAGGSTMDWEYLLLTAHRV